MGHTDDRGDTGSACRAQLSRVRSGPDASSGRAGTAPTGRGAGWPNVVLTLDQKMIVSVSGVQMSYSALGSPGVTFVEPENSLEYLLVSLFSIIQNGMTSSADAFDVVPPPMKRSHTFVP